MRRWIGQALDAADSFIEGCLYALSPLLVLAAGFACYLLLANEVIRIEWAGTLILLTLTGALAWFIRRQLGRDWKSDGASRDFAAALFAICVGGFVFGPYAAETIAGFANWAGLKLDWLLVPADAQPTNIAPTAVDEGQTLKERIEILLPMVVPFAAAVASVSVVVKLVAPQLEGVLKYIGLSEAQIEAGHRLRQPVANAITSADRLNLTHPQQINLTPTSLSPSAPHMREVDGAKALIRINLPSTPDPRTEAFQFEEMRELMANAGISLPDSLFFVYGAGKAGEAPPLCYGTGLELIELLAPAGSEACARLHGRFSETFTRALKHGDAPTVQSLAEEARQAILSQNPGDDVLLSKTSIREGEELITVMRTMTEHKLRRILVTSHRAPRERAILSAAEISAFLVPAE